MHIRIRKASIYYLLSGVALTYLLTFGLWDSMSMIPKICFNLFIMIGILYSGLLIVKGRDLFGDQLFKLLYILSIIYYFLSAVILTPTLLKSSGLYMYIYYQAVLLAALFLWKRINVSTLFPIFQAVGFVSTILAIYEVMRGSLLLGGTAYGKNFGGLYVVRAVVFSGSFLTLGMFFSIIILISIYKYWLNGKKIDLISAIINVVGLITTSSRGPFVATIIAGLIMYFFMFAGKRKRDMQRIFNLLIKAIVLIIIVIVLGNIFFDDNFYWNYVSARLHSIFDWSRESGNVSRINRWRQFGELFKSDWLLGIGVGSTGTKASSLTGAINPESGVFKRFLELGVIGSFIYYIMVFSALMKGIQYCKKNTKLANERFLPLSVSIIIAILIEECVMQITETIMVAALFWLFIGHILSCTMQMRELVTDE